MDHNEGSTTNRRPHHLLRSRFHRPSSYIHSQRSSVWGKRPGFSRLTRLVVDFLDFNVKSVSILFDSQHMISPLMVFEASFLTWKLNSCLSSSNGPPVLGFQCAVFGLVCASFLTNPVNTSRILFAATASSTRLLSGREHKFSSCDEQFIEIRSRATRRRCVARSAIIKHRSAFWHYKMPTTDTPV